VSAQEGSLQMRMAMEIIEKDNLIYLAGILDGEGWIGIVKTEIRRNEKSARYYLIIAISNTSKELMDWLCSKVGGTYCLAKENRKEWKDHYKWDLTGESAYKILQKVYPYLVVKREQAKMAMEFQLKRSITKQRRNGIPEEELLLREYYYQLLKGLNKRGK